MNDLVQRILKGRVAASGGERPNADLDWNAHPAFKGVSLLHLVKGRDTDGQFSSHLVRVEQGCAIGDHVHQDNWELHEVVAGSGACVVNGQGVAYEPGVSGVMPKGVKHMVAAEKGDLYILAKFIPALV